MGEWGVHPFRADRRHRAVAGDNGGFIEQREDTLADGTKNLVHIPTPEVGPTDARGEQGIARQELLGWSAGAGLRLCG